MLHLGQHPGRRLAECWFRNPRYSAIMGAEWAVCWQPEIPLAAGCAVVSVRE
jgi:hypothetical protein